MSQYYNPWGDAAQGVAAIGQTMASTMLQAQALRAQQAQRQQQAQMMDAHAGLYHAQAGLADAKQGQIKAEQADEAAFADSLANLQSAMTSGGDSRAAGVNAMRAFGKVASKNPEKAMDFMGRMQSMIESNGSQDATAKYAARMGAPVQHGAAVTDTQWQQVNNPPLRVGANQTLVNPPGSENPGSRFAQGLVTLNQGERAFQPEANGSLPADPSATGLPPAAKSSAVEQARAKFVSEILADRKMDARSKQSAIRAFDMQMGIDQAPATNAPAAVAPDAPGTGQNSGVGDQAMRSSTQRPAPAADPHANLRAQAQDAIARGKDPRAVSARFKQMTGQDL